MAPIELAGGEDSPKLKHICPQSKSTFYGIHSKWGEKGFSFQVCESEYVSVVCESECVSVVCGRVSVSQ